jgi:hypothetical protein
MRAVATIVLLAATLLFVVGRQRNWDFTRALAVFKPPRPQAPEDAVYKMLDTARAGDTKGYLNCFSGSMRDQLAQVVRETTEIKFAKYLARQNAAFTGVAVSVKESSAEGFARVRVEYVYGSRNEVQDLYLRKENDQWKIFKVAGSEQTKTLIPYGTVVTD